MKMKCFLRFNHPIVILCELNFTGLPKGIPYSRIRENKSWNVDSV